MPCTGHDFIFDETVLDPHSETHMATIFLYKRAPDEFFRHAHSPRAEGVWLRMRGTPQRAGQYISQCHDALTGP